MSQIVVAACRINAGSVPDKVVKKVVGEEIVKQIRAEAVDELRGERERARQIEARRNELWAERMEGVRRRIHHRSLIRRALDPIATAWATAYACCTLWPGAILDRLVDWLVKKDWIGMEDD